MKIAIAVILLMFSSWVWADGNQCQPYTPACCGHSGGPQCPPVKP